MQAAMLLRQASGEARRSVLQLGERQISTVEHLLAACAGLGLTGLEAQLDGDELPALDGSALPFCLALLSLPRRQPSRAYRVCAPLEVSIDDSWLRFEPNDRLEIDCQIAFAQPSIGLQRMRYVADPRRFLREIAPARTFGFVEDLQQLHDAGLALGANQDNVAAFRANRRPPLRFDDEPVRHKILDLIGDLALLGAPLAGKLIARRPSHRVTLSALKQAAETKGILESCALDH